MNVYNKPKSVEFSPEGDHLTTYLLENPGRSRPRSPLIRSPKMLNSFKDLPPHPVLFYNLSRCKTPPFPANIPYAYMAGMIQLKERFILNLIQISTTTMVSSCHSPTQPQLELELDLIMGRNPPHPTRNF
jgi:hypothetical protein